MSFYNDAGLLFLGTRLRRLSDNLLQEISKAYKLEGIDFEVSWFPIFFLLDTHPFLSITEISKQLGVSHPAIIQLCAVLKARKLIASKIDKADGRKNLIYLTNNGNLLLKKIKPVWSQIESAMNNVVSVNPKLKGLLETIEVLEKVVENERISYSINNSNQL